MKKIIAGILLLSLNYVCAQSQTRQTLTVGDKAPALTPYKWIKGEVKSFQKGKVYLLEFGATWCHGCITAVPHLSALQKQFPNTLSVVSLFVMEAQKNDKDVAYVEHVRNYVKEQGEKMNYVVGTDYPKGLLAKKWLQDVSENGIPQALIVDKNGRIAWIGNPNYPNLSGVIKEIISPEYSIDSAIKYYREAQAAKPQPFDNNHPIQPDMADSSRDAFMFRSLLTPYHGESAYNYVVVFGKETAKVQFSKMPSGYRTPGLVQQIGVSIDNLYFLAYGDTIGQQFPSRQLGSEEYPDTIAYPLQRSRYGDFWYKALLEVKDTTPFDFSYRYPFNRYNYSLLVPEKKATAAYMQQVMRRDLANYFGYDVRVEERMMPCWKIVATEKAKKELPTKTPGQKYRVEKVGDTLFHEKNALMKDIVLRFSFPFNQWTWGIYRAVRPVEEAPFIDFTGITGEIDYEFLAADWKALVKGDMSAGVRILHRNGLDLVKGEKLTKVVVIRDPAN